MNRTHFLDYPDTFIWIFCVASGHFPNYPEILQPIMSMSQKLSGFAKTFRSALLTRWQGFSDSGYIHMTLRRDPEVTTSGGVSLAPALTDGGEGNIVVGTSRSMYGSVKPLEGPVHYTLESCGQGCSVLIERSSDWFNQFQDWAEIWSQKIIKGTKSINDKCIYLQ